MGPPPPATCHLPPPTCHLPPLSSHLPLPTSNLHHLHLPPPSYHLLPLTSALTYRSSSAKRDSRVPLESVIVWSRRVSCDCRCLVCLGPVPGVPRAQCLVCLVC